MTSASNLTSVIAVFPVADYDAAIAWYAKWIGRQPDVEPADGVAEWQIAEQAWIQVSTDPAPAGQTTVVIGVADLDAQRASCAAAGAPWGEVNDYGFLKTTAAQDPAGNTITFVQEVAQEEGRPG
jgi:catechol 2,3-dioxygenase-like lactoylglutathione lyase family enzyme